jgi:DNA-binding LacI/PurR family transcriptional regulator
VLIGFTADPTGLTCVDLDFRRAGAACVDYLAALGHRGLALLGAPTVVYERDTGFAHRTRAGFLSTAASYGIPALAMPCAEDADAVRDDLARLLSEHPDVTGLVVHNEAAVSHVLAALTAVGRRVPDDVSVLSICPDEIAERATPPLTSVLVPAEQVGREAVRLLISKLDGRAVPDATLLDPLLTVRHTTAPAPVG